MSEPTAGPTKKQVQVVVATSVMLTFISFWRAAAIVLNDLASSAYYAAGIAEKAVGPAAPWFVLGVMLFSYAVRAVYVESCAMFTRGGVYRVVKEAMGGVLAKFSVSALMFDYVLTGPISGVSAGQYVVGLVIQAAAYAGLNWHTSDTNVNRWAALIAILVTLYFWWRNIQGIHESSDDALKIMSITTVMVVLLVGWSFLTIFMKPETQRLPPVPIPSNLSFDKDAVGWVPKLLPGSLQQMPPAPGAEPNTGRFTLGEKPGLIIGLIGILMAFGHSLLAMSGEESLAQVNRELEHPKHQNLLRAGMVIFIYSLVFTSLVSFFAFAIIPDKLRASYSDNLISGIAVYLVGPTPLKLLFQAFIVVVGFLILAGGINTSLIGANGVLNRVSEDGVIPKWFRVPHPRYGTTYRLVNLIGGLQLCSIIASRGDTYTLGEAYAFGVVWSFALKGLAMLVLRYKQPGNREWKVPGNFYIGNLEIPVGLGLIAALLFGVAIVNLFTKEVATISGLGFTACFFTLFVGSEYVNKKQTGGAPPDGIEEFRLKAENTITADLVEARPGNVLCVVRDHRHLEHLRLTLNRVDTTVTDLVVMSAQIAKGPDAGYEGLDETRVFTTEKQLLFSHVVTLAEKSGRTVRLLVVPSSDIFEAIVQTMYQLHSSEVVMGKAHTLTPEQQSWRLGLVWERLPVKPSHDMRFRIIDSTGAEYTFSLGAHAPLLTAAHVDLIHKLWLELRQEPGLEGIHHQDVVNLGLHHLKQAMSGPERAARLQQLREICQLPKVG